MAVAVEELLAELGESERKAPEAPGCTLPVGSEEAREALERVKFAMTPPRKRAGSEREHAARKRDAEAAEQQLTRQRNRCVKRQMPAEEQRERAARKAPIRPRPRPDDERPITAVGDRCRGAYRRR